MAIFLGQIVGFIIVQHLPVLILTKLICIVSIEKQTDSQTEQSFQMHQSEMIFLSFRLVSLAL